ARALRALLPSIDIDLRDALSVERLFPTQDLVEDDPDGEEICAQIDLLPVALQDLGSHVTRSSSGVRCVRWGRRTFAVDLDRAVWLELRKPPIGDVDLAVIADEDILRLYVAVEDAARVRVTERARDLKQYAHEPRRRPLLA